ncbi:MAG: endonuclease/exonuclease/phosphatase family protein [Phycisphaerae bacterium]|nr:endonuclease/exonuclease/phosphatase family protein [Phycisphaerae bacterium]
MKFIFWNIDKKNRADLLADLVHEQHADVLMLAESATPSEELIAALSNRGTDFSLATFESRKVAVFFRPGTAHVIPRLEYPHVVTAQLDVDGAEPILLAVAHLRDLRNSKPTDKHSEAEILQQLIREEEVRAGHQRTVLVGDLNMDPHHEAMIRAGGLHGVMARSIAEQRTRTVADRQYEYFYNPMWGLYGDRDGRPPGTYYYRGSYVTQFWHMLDQVLVRPALLEAFPTECVIIIDRVAERSLLTCSGLPDRENASDHLPIMFELNLG